MRISENGIALIKMFEGLELDSYQDIAGVWTIGYGHTETAGPDQHISEREAEELLRHDLDPRERAVQQLSNVPLNQNEFDALVSFVFNVGIGGFKGSTARRRLNRNDRVGAADALTWWNKATVDGNLREVTGLTRRRAAEKALFLTPVEPPVVNDPKDIAENSRITPTEEAPRRESLGESRTIQGATIAGGAGAAASTIGKDSAEELDKVETNIQDGTGLTEKPAGEGLPGDGATTDGAAPGDGAGSSADGVPGGGTATDDGTPTDGATTDDATPDGATTDGSTDSGATDGGSAAGGATDGATADAGAAAGSTDAGDGTVAGGGGAATGATGDSLGEGAAASDAAPAVEGAPADGTARTIEMGVERPSKHEKHAVDAQLQFALLIIIVLSALYVIVARIDDWWRYRR